MTDGSGSGTSRTSSPALERLGTEQNLAGGLLVLAGVCKDWAGRPVLEDVGLSVAHGELLLIRGANGTGKTTLLRIAAGVIRPAAGSVTIDGLHPEHDRRAYLSRLGFLPAGSRSLYARLNARRHLELFARLALLPSAASHQAIESALDIFGLTDYADRRVDRLSMGQRQRVALALTFIHSPELVLLDEPTNSLDGEGLAVLGHYLEMVRARGGAAVACSPDGVETGLPHDKRLRLEGGRLWPD